MAKERNADRSKSTREFLLGECVGRSRSLGSRALIAAWAWEAKSWHASAGLHAVRGTGDQHDARGTREYTAVTARGWREPNAP